MRPKRDEGQFQLGIIGQNFDPVELVDRKKFVDFFHEKTGRKDITFKEITTLTYWK